MEASNNTSRRFICFFPSLQLSTSKIFVERDDLPTGFRMLNIRTAEWPSSIAGICFEAIFHQPWCNCGHSNIFFENLFHKLGVITRLSRPEMHKKDAKLFIKFDWREINIPNTPITKDPLLLQYIKQHCAIQQALVRHVSGVGNAFFSTFWEYTVIK